MALLAENKALLAKLEAMYNQTPNPTGVADYIKTVDLSASPLQAGNVDIEEDSPSGGSSTEIAGRQSGVLSYGINIAGSGAAATKPQWDVPVECSGFVSSAVNVNADWGSGNTYNVGDKVQEDVGADSDVPFLCVKPHDSVDANKPGIAGGNPYWIRLKKNISVQYRPIADLSLTKSYWSAVYQGGQLFNIGGCRNNMAIALTAGSAPRMNFTVNGNPQSRSTIAVPSVTDRSKTPLVVSFANSGFSFGLDARKLVLNNLSIDLGNTTTIIDEPNRSAADITGKAISGSILFEMPPIDDVDYWTQLANITPVPLMFSQGNSDGNIVQFVAPAVTLSNVDTDENEGRLMVSADLRFKEAEGADELFIFSA